MEYLLLFLGALAYCVFNLNKEFKTDTFTWKTFLTNHGAAVALNLILGVILIISKSAIGEDFGLIRYAVYGFTAQTIFLPIVEAFNIKVKTTVGLNKKQK